MNADISEATSDDTERIVEFNANIHHAAEGPNRRIAARTTDLLTTHPLTTVDDTLIATDLDGRLVGSVSTIPHSVVIRGVELAAVTIEFLGVAPDSRGEGLARRLMNAAHERHEHTDVQFLIGRPGFYQQFGYHPALHDGTTTPEWMQLSDGAIARPAEPDDASDLATLFGRERNDLVHVVRDADMWAYEIGGRAESSVFRRAIWMVEHDERGLIGAAATAPNDSSQITALRIPEHERSSALGALANASDRPRPSLLVPDRQRHPRRGRAGHVKMRVRDEIALLQRVATAQPLTAAHDKLGDGFTITIGRGAAEVRFGPGGVECNPLPPRDDWHERSHVYLPMAVFFPLVCGSCTADELAATHLETGFVSPMHLDTVRTLFPMSTTTTWHMG